MTGLVERKPSAVMTVSELITAYLAANTPRQRDEERLARWWMEHLGDCPAQTLTTEQIQAQLQTPVHRRRSPWTANFYLRFLRRVCTWGTRLAYLPADPCATISLPKDRPTVLRVLTEEEERRLCAELPSPYAWWVRFAILTGLTRSEQFALRWQEVDLERARLLLPRQEPRAVRLAPEAVAVLRELKRLHPVSVWVFPDLRNPTRPANIHSFYTGRWATAIRRAGIPWCAWKDLRHTAGVRFAQAGLRPVEVAALLRQREMRQAYYYRAWQPGQAYIPRPRRGKTGLVFSELSPSQLQRLLSRDPRVAPLTVTELCHFYAAHHLRHRPSRPQFDRIFRRHFQQWSARLAESLTRKEIRAWYASLAHTPSVANTALTFLRSGYNLAIECELLTGGNPAVGIKRYRETQRERFLSVDELHRFMSGLPSLPLKPQAFLSILVFTGCRNGEARLMRWADVDLHTRLWRKPRTKTGVSHCVPLPVQVIETLSRVPRTSAWVFPGANGQPWSRAGVEKTWGQIRRRWELDDVTLHDLRRSCASYLAISGENLPTIQNVLNHRSLSPTSIYARLNTKAVDRALQAQADRICSLTNSTELLPAPAQQAG